MYKYPDVDDQNLFTNVINADWDDGGLEYQYIAECFSSISTVDQSIMLDAGCGMGRLMHAYFPFVDKVIAVDPDPDRLSKAKGRYNDLQAGVNQLHNVQFINSFIQDLKLESQVDIALCSHIIQHVHTQDISIILNKLHQVLKPNGHLMLLTTNWRPGEGRYLKVNHLNNEHVIIDEEEYNECVLANDCYVPVKLFSEDELNVLLQDAKFRIIFFKRYHGYPKIKGDNFIFAQAI